MISWPLFSYVLLAAMRDRLIFSILLSIAVVASLSIVVGSAAVVEAGQFSTVFVAGSLRFVGVLGLTLFTVFYIRRSMDNKDLDFLLSRPISRVSYILSHAAAFSVLAVIVTAIIILVVMSIYPHGLYNRLPIWGFSILAEMVIMTNVALFFSMVLPSATAGVLATLGLYALARMMGELLGIVEHDLSYQWLVWMGWVLQTVSLIVPRLDLMGQTSWLIYGGATIGYGFIFAQMIVYTGLVLAAAIVDLSRRQF